MRDLPAQYPGKVQEPDGLWNKWAWTNHVLPKKAANKVVQQIRGLAGNLWISY